MSWYKCNDCGHIFEDGEFVVKSEYMGECWGIPAYDEFCYCPSCGGDGWEEAGHCAKCHGIFLGDELTEGLCDECLREIAMAYKYDIAKCYALSKASGEKESVSIDPFLACMFTAEQINEVLYRELAIASAVKPVDCTPFIEADRYWFDERIAEEVKENDNRRKG